MQFGFLCAALCVAYGVYAGMVPMGLCMRAAFGSQPEPVASSTLFSPCVTTRNPTDSLMSECDACHGEGDDEFTVYGSSC